MIRAANVAWSLPDRFCTPSCAARSLAASASLLDTNAAILELAAASVPAIFCWSSCSRSASTKWRNLVEEPCCLTSSVSTSVLPLVPVGPGEPGGPLLPSVPAGPGLPCGPGGPGAPLLGQGPLRHRKRRRRSCTRMRSVSSRSLSKAWCSRHTCTRAPASEPSLGAPGRSEREHAPCPAPSGAASWRAT